MSDTSTHIPADVTWRDDDVPVSVEFDDAYFAYTNGLEETRAVFIGGNDLVARWAHGDGVRIAELGFGTGLNFLATLQEWRAFRAALPDPVDGTSVQPELRLTYTSFELAPMSCDDMVRAVSRWPGLTDLAAPVVAAWPPRGDVFCVHWSRPIGQRLRGVANQY